MVVIEDTFYAPAKLMRCFELLSGNIKFRIADGSGNWEVEGANPLHGGGQLLLLQREFSSTTYYVYGIIEEFSQVAFSDVPEVTGYTFLLANEFAIHIRLLWESEFPYEITLQKTSNDIWSGLNKTFSYPQIYRFAFAQMGGRSAETAKGTSLTFYNDNLLDYKKKVLSVHSWKRDDLNIYRHTVNRSKDSFVPDYGDFMSIQL